MTETTETTIPKWLKDHFPQTPEQARGWQAHVRCRALHARVLCVARTRIEGAWAAYCAPVPGMNHVAEMEPVLESGNKMPEDVARAMFPAFKGVPYAR
jgi:hypothetical protein